MKDFSDRRLHMIGIGGAGMSGTGDGRLCLGRRRVRAATARAPATPSGCARFGIPVALGHDPYHLDDGMEVVVSSAPSPPTSQSWRPPARAACAVLHRGELLAEMVAARRSVCVAGAHGKTTTTAMIAYAADELGLDPTFLIGGEVPQLGGNAGPGGGDLLVAEADESDGSLALLRPQRRGGHQHRARPPRPLRLRAELRELFAAWVAAVPDDGTVAARRRRRAAAPPAPRASGSGSPAAPSGTSPGSALTADGSSFWLTMPDGTPVQVALAVPGRPQRRRTPPARSRPLHARARTADAAAALAGFTGAGRRFERRGERAGVRGDRRLRPPPDRVGGGDRGRPRPASAARGGLLPAAPVLAHRSAGRPLRRGARERRRGRGDRDLRRPRAAVEGVTAKLVVDAASERRPGMPLAYSPPLEEAADYLRTRLRAGDLVLTVGAGDVRRVGDLLLT